MSDPDNGRDTAPDRERDMDRAQERQHERAKTVEDILGDVGTFLDEQKYPTTGEELAVEYGDARDDLPNETESMGDVFDRLVDERFESAEEAREAVYNGVTGEAGGMEEYNDERDLDHTADMETDRRQ
ncbi:DUF5789 family protein [Haloarchaeobius sp. TZWWS8]|uniref:DUF5789 family protein n=1 Tax=Haloarchaeobius sp. TZWWS8 TaxID=3446121 RepID=UPI003EBB0027